MYLNLIELVHIAPCIPSIPCNDTVPMGNSSLRSCRRHVYFIVLVDIRTLTLHETLLVACL